MSAGVRAGAQAPVALSMGDPAGVAAEITVGAWRALKETGPVFFSIADLEHLCEVGDAPIAVISDPAEAADAFRSALPVIPEALTVRPVHGAPSPKNAAAVVKSIERTVALTQSGQAAAIATPPISKKALYDGADFKYPGHTEFLAALSGVDRSVMMLACDELRTVPVTIHVPLSDVKKLLTTGLIVETGLIVNKALRRDFAIDTPRIAISGLNPHAGEGGAMGREDIEVIEPAVQALRAQGIDATGPLPADTMFHAAARARYDAALCMYHDQALIPIKTLAFDKGVNVTLGLPFIRTSPDHGVAYDIAGRGMADPTSMIEAIRLAATLAANRAAA